MPKVVACIIARTVSKRLPLKVLRDFAPHLSMLDFLIGYVKSQTAIDEVYLCTSKEEVDDILEDVAARNGIKIYRGAADEVIERMLAVGAIEKADILVRITGDNPFTAVELIGTQVQFLLDNQLDYVRVTDLPLGATAEVFTHDALIRCNELMDPKVSEYLMLYLFEPENFKCGVVKAYAKDLSAYSLTVDKPDDFIRSKNILSALHFNGDFSVVTLSSVIAVLEDESVHLPARIIGAAGQVKLPFDKVISYQEFKDDMERRVTHSKHLHLYE